MRDTTRQEGSERSFSEIKFDIRFGLLDLRLSGDRWCAKRQALGSTDETTQVRTGSVIAFNLPPFISLSMRGRSAVNGALRGLDHETATRRWRHYIEPAPRGKDKGERAGP
jgi:hypothetical protein